MAHNEVKETKGDKELRIGKWAISVAGFQLDRSCLLVPQKVGVELGEGLGRFFPGKIKSLGAFHQFFPFRRSSVKLACTTDGIPKCHRRMIIVAEAKTAVRGGIIVGDELMHAAVIFYDRQRSISHSGYGVCATESKRGREQNHVCTGQTQLAQLGVCVRAVSKTGGIFSLRDNDFGEILIRSLSGHNQACICRQNQVYDRFDGAECTLIIRFDWKIENNSVRISFQLDLIQKCLPGARFSVTGFGFLAFAPQFIERRIGFKE